MRVLLLRPVPGNERFGLGPFFRIEPLGMEYIAAALEARGHDVTLVDLRFGRPVEHYLKARPGLVGIAAMHALETENVLDLVARIRRASPQVPLVIGGHTAAAYPAPFVNAAIDAIVLDDGERAVPRLVDALDRDRPWSSVPGVAIRGADGAWVRTPADDDVFELDDVPSPARRHVDRWRRQYACLAHRPTWLIETARGCPYRCSFCSIWQLHARSVRERSIGSVCDDFERVGDDVFVADDLFWYHPSRSLELAHALRKRGIRKKWVLVQSRVDTVARHPELLEAWRPIAREFDIFFGLEAASDDGLKGLVKDATVGQTEQAIEVARGLGYGVTGNFVIDPAWQEPDFERLWDFVDRHGLHQAGFTILTPLPGTAYFEEMRPRLGARKWAHFDMHHLLWEPALGAAAVFRALLRDLAPLRAQPGWPQERLAVAAAGRAAQRDVPDESAVAHAADDGPAALRGGIRSRQPVGVRRRYTAVSRSAGAAVGRGQVMNLPDKDSSVMRRRDFARLIALGGSAALVPRNVFAVPPLAATPQLPDERFWRTVRDQFLMPPDLAVMNAANLCPSPAPVLEAVYRNTKDIDADPSFDNRQKMAAGKEETRRLVAAWLRVTPEEIVLTRNTSEANNLVSSGLDLKSGDEVVIFSDNHPSNNDAWKTKSKRFGYSVSVIEQPNPHPGADFYVEAFTRAITPRTRVLAFSHQTSTVGDVLPARELSRLARERGILTLIDGASAIGFMDLDLGAIQPDFYTGSAHKWPCGPKEVGVLYLNERAQRALHPSIISAYPGAVGSSRTFEAMGQRDEPAIIGFGEAIKFQNGIGLKAIEARGRALAQALIAGLGRIDGVHLWTHPDPSRSGTIVTFRPGNLDVRKLAAALYQKDRIGCATRTGQDRPGIRLSPHIYNTMAEIDRAVSAVATYMRQGVS